MARVRLSGSSDCFSKTEICCGRPSSVRAKSSFVRLPTMAPFWSVTLANTLTSFTSTCSVVSCAGTRGAQADAMARRARMARRLRVTRALQRNTQLGRERLAGRPHGSVDESLLLPDGDGLLECVDDPTAGI